MISVNNFPDTFYNSMKSANNHNSSSSCSTPLDLADQTYTPSSKADNTLSSPRNAKNIPIKEYMQKRGHCRTYLTVAYKNATQYIKEVKKEGMESYVAFNSLGHIQRDENPEEIPFTSRIVPRGLSVEEGPETALHNAAHLFDEAERPA